MAQHHPSPPMGMHLHHQQGPPPPPLAAGQPNGPAAYAPSRQIPLANEATWLAMGKTFELMSNTDEAGFAYERALVANPNSIPAMNAISLMLRSREEFPQAVEYLQRILKLDQQNGEVWGSLGHCFLMMDDLQQAYAAYQNALVHLQNPKEPKLWYGIGILYDRYGSLDHAEEAFAQVMKMQPDFEKANEIYFRLGIIYKQQQKYGDSLECFKYIVQSPPPPLTEEDIWFQIGHVHEQQKDHDSAKAAYLRVLERDPNHAKVLQQLGWLHHSQSNSFSSQDRAIDYLEKSVAADGQDAQSWYLLGRCYMAQHKFPKAYEAYQQAVYRDGRNPTFWCSIGVLYYQINQYRDALDAYSRAIRLNPFISEVWYDLGTLYESCNNQVSDALDAYQRAAELDPNNVHIKARLHLLRNGPASGAAGSAPMPHDVHPQAYQPGAVGPPGPQWAGSGPPPQQGQPQNGPPPPPPPPPPGPGGANGWARLNEVNPPQPPPQPPNPYEQQRGEPFRGGPVPPIARQPSPRAPQEQQMRPYGEANRPGPLRGPTPPGPAHYSGRPPPPQQPPQQQQPPPPPPPSSSRVPNPSYSGHAPTSNGLPSINSVNNGPPPPPPGMMPYRTNSPRHDPRPMHDNRMPSPKSAYPQHHQPYPPHPDANRPIGLEPGHPQGPSRGPDPMHMDHDRPSSVGPKRMREWEDEPSVKKPASDETRARLEDIRHRRPSTPPRGPPEPYRRNSSEARRFEEQRRIEEQQRRVEDQRRAEDMRRAEEQRHANDSYHPSEAAHHPPSHSMPNHLPPMQQGPSPMQQGPSPMQEMMHNGPPPGPSSKDYPSQEDSRHRVEHPPAPHPPASHGEPERAARKMDVDEDYDDSGEDDKKATVPQGQVSGPGSSTGDIKNTTPTSAGINGMMGPKVEGP